MNKLRFGILSTGGIGRKKLEGHFSIPAISIVTAVASRDGTRSREFIRECQREFPFAAEPAALGSYEELLASERRGRRVHPGFRRLAQGMGFARGGGGKHVICEKPCGVSFADVQEMADACRKIACSSWMGCDVHAQPAVAARSVKCLTMGKASDHPADTSSAFSIFAPPDEFTQATFATDGRLEPPAAWGFECNAPVDY